MVKYRINVTLPTGKVLGYDATAYSVYPSGVALKLVSADARMVYVGVGPGVVVEVLDVDAATKATT